MKILLQICMVAVACTAVAQGTSEEAVRNYSSTITGSADGTAGWTFKPNSAFAITQLGALTNVVAGHGSIRVGLWAANGALIRSNLVTAAGEQVNQSYYSSIEPLWVVPLQTYHLGLFPSTGNQVFLNIYEGDPTNTVNWVELTPMLQLGGLAQGAGGFTFPAALAGWEGGMWLGPNFRYVPEPSALTLVGVGVLSALVWRRSGFRARR